MKDTLIRSITGFVFVFIMMASVFWSQWSFIAIISIVNMLALSEFYILFEKDGINPQKITGIIFGTYMIWALPLSFAGIIGIEFVFLVIPVLYLLFLKALYKEHQKAFLKVGITILGLTYISLALSLFTMLAFTSGKYSYEIIAGCLILLWVYDSSAYMFGRLFGKRPLFKSISPNKSHEGAWGGALLAIIASFIISHFFFHALDLWHWVVIAIIIIVTGTFGDLIESLLKRNMNIKDSGTLLPGHGGILDRFDALFFASPFIFTFCILFA